MSSQINTVQLGTYTRIESADINSTIENTLTTRGIEFTSRLQHRVAARTTKHCIVYTLHSIQGLRYGDTAVTPQIYVFNSYAKESALTIMVGFLRAVCSNGMVVGEDLYSTRIIHRTGPTLDQKVSQIETGIAAAVDIIQSGEIQRLVDELVSMQVSADQGISIVGSLPIPKRVKEHAMNKWAGPHSYRRPEDSDNNLWTLWNIINEIMRLRSRSIVANLERNRGLLDDILALYQHETCTPTTLELVA